MKTNFQTNDARSASAPGVGRTEATPTFGISEIALMLSTNLWDTPTLDANRNGAIAAITGATDADGFQTSATNKIIMPRAGRTVFNVNNGMTLMWVGKSAVGQELFGDYSATTGTGYAGIFLNSAAVMSALSRDDGGTNSSAPMPPPANMDTVNTLVFGLFGLSFARLAYFRTSTSLVLGDAVARATPAAVGRTTATQQAGGYPGSTSKPIALQSFQGVLNAQQMLLVAQETVRNMEAAGKTL